MAVDFDVIFEEIIDSISKGRLTILCGAGISFPPPSNLPTGVGIKRGLLIHLLEDDRIEAQVEELFNANNEIWERIKTYQFEYFMSNININMPIVRCISDIYRSGSPNIIHLFLAKLFVEGFTNLIFTSNFDTKIEEAIALLNPGRNFNKFIQEEDFLKDIFQPDSPTIVKLHGCCSDPSSIRTTLEAVANNTLAEKRRIIVQNYFGDPAHDILVLGYSFSDEFDVNNVIRTLDGDFHDKKIYHIKHNPTGSPPVISELDDPINNYSGYKIEINTEELIRALSNNLGFSFDECSRHNQEEKWENIIHDWAISENRGLRLFTYASVYWAIRAWKEALPLFHESLRNYDELEDQRGKANALGQIAMIQKDMGDYELAEKNLLQCEELYESVGDQNQKGKVFHQRAMIRHNIGDYVEAERLFDEAIRTYHDYPVGIALCLGEIAAIRFITGRYGDAEKLIGDSLQINESEGNLPGIAVNYHDMALIKLQLGDYASAEELLNKSLMIKNRLGDLVGKAYTLVQIGIIWHEKNELVKAEEVYTEAQQIFIRVGDQKGIGSALGQIARIRSDEGNIIDAEKLYDQIECIYSKLGNMNEIAITFHQKGNLFFRQKKYGKAKDLYLEAKKIFERIGNKKGIAGTLLQLSSIHFMYRNIPDALNLAEEAYDRFLIINDRKGIENAKRRMELLKRARNHSN